MYPMMRMKNSTYSFWTLISYVEYISGKIQQKEEVISYI